MQYLRVVIFRQAICKETGVGRFVFFEDFL